MATRPNQQQPVGALSRFHPLFDRLLFVLALLGVLVTAHLIIQQGRGFDRGCLGFSAPTGVAADCNVVVQSEAGKLFGVSNAVWGLAYYVVVAVLGAGILLAAAPVVSRLKKARAALIGIGLLYSLYLVGYQIFQVGEYCVLCLTSAAIVALMAVTQAVEFVKHRNETAMPLMSSRPARQLTFVSALAVLVMLLVGADVLYFNRLSVAAPAPGAVAEAGYNTGASPAAAEPVMPEPTECTYNPQKAPIENYKAMVSFGDPMKGNPQAPVTVVEVFEPNCGHCKTAHPVIKEAAAKYADKAAFYFKPVVFWPQLSANQVAALYAANQEGHFFEMLDRQFAAQNPRTGLSLAQLKEMADAVGMNGEAMVQRIESGMYNMMTRQQTFQLTQVYGVNSTPMILINGRVVSSDSRTVNCIGQFIEQAAAGQK